MSIWDDFSDRSFINGNTAFQPSSVIYLLYPFSEKWESSTWLSKNIIQKKQKRDCIIKKASKCWFSLLKSVVTVMVYLSQECNRWLLLEKKYTLTWLLRQLLKHAVFLIKLKGFCKGDWKKKQYFALLNSHLMMEMKVSLAGINRTFTSHQKSKKQKAHYEETRFPMDTVQHLLLIFLLIYRQRKWVIFGIQKTMNSSNWTMPKGIRMAETTLKENGYEPDPNLH